MDEDKMLTTWERAILASFKRIAENANRELEEYALKQRARELARSLGEPGPDAPRERAVPLIMPPTLDTLPSIPRDATVREVRFRCELLIEDGRERWVWQQVSD